MILFQPCGLYLGDLVLRRSLGRNRGDWSRLHSHFDRARRSSSCEPIIDGGITRTCPSCHLTLKRSSKQQRRKRTQSSVFLLEPASQVKAGSQPSGDRRAIGRSAQRSTIPWSLPPTVHSRTTLGKCGDGISTDKQSANGRSPMQGIRRSPCWQVNFPQSQLH